MNRILLLLLTLITLFGSNLCAGQPEKTSEGLRPPNIVVIFIDDLGYADIGPFGAKDYETPNLNQMALEGRKFTDFVASTAVCSASRISLLTGCYHRRVGIAGALGPNSKVGINANEMTLAELCKQKDYATACFGKWHLGTQKPFLPLQHGFDEYYGLPYSNDMWPLHPAYADLPPDAAKRKQGYPDLPLIEGNEIVDTKVTGEDQAQLTTDYTNKAVDFINRNADNPFLLYVPHSMVHVPLFVSDKFKGKSEAGIFGDVMMEVDWSVGEILGAIRKNELQDNTLVIFTSDNGPWLSYGNHAGSAFPLREGKGTMHEGGYRVPTIMWWPGKIPMSSNCDEFCSTIDVFPTVAKLIGGVLPDHKIDGKDISELIFDVEGARSPHNAFYCYYGGGQLQAVRNRRFKLQFPHQYRSMNGNPGGTEGKPNPYQQLKIGLELFDLKNDIGETTNVADQHPDVVAELQRLAEIAREDLGDRLTERKGEGIRPAGRVEN
jgi:arylsulfatase A-like enzyme